MIKVLVGPNPMGLENGLPDLREDNPQIEFSHCSNSTALKEAIQMRIFIWAV